MHDSICMEKYLYNIDIYIELFFIFKQRNYSNNKVLQSSNYLELKNKRENLFYRMFNNTKRNKSYKQFISRIMS